MENFEDFVISHMPLAEKIAKNKKYKLLTREETISAAYLGLVQASKKFQKLPEDRFTYVATRCIINAIKDAVRLEIIAKRVAIRSDIVKFAKPEIDSTIEGVTSQDKDLYRMICLDNVSKLQAGKELGLKRDKVEHGLRRLWRLIGGANHDKIHG